MSENLGRSDRGVLELYYKKGWGVAGLPSDIRVRYGGRGLNIGQN